MKVWESCCLVWVLVTAFFGGAAIEGAAMWSTDPCPPGVNPGEEWLPEGSACTKCSCFPLQRQPGYSCFTCGVTSLLLTTEECYAGKSRPDENYPECCQVEEFCPGHERYNASLAGITAVG